MVLFTDKNYVRTFSRFNGFFVYSSRYGYIESFVITISGFSACFFVVPGDIVKSRFLCIKLSSEDRSQEKGSNTKRKGPSLIGGKERWTRISSAVFS